MDTFHNPSQFTTQHNLIHHMSNLSWSNSKFFIIIIIIKGIYTAQVRKGHKCAMSAEMEVWLRNCPCLYRYLHN